VIPSSRFSNFARTLGPTVPAPNNAAANNYRAVQDFSDDADTATIRGDQVLPGHNLFQRFMYYKGSQLNPSVFSYSNLPQEGTELRRGRYVGDVAAPGQRDQGRLQLRLPSQLAGQHRRPQLGRRHRSA
jgi:hypothetical protein